MLLSGVKNIASHRIQYGVFTIRIPSSFEKLKVKLEIQNGEMKNTRSEIKMKCNVKYEYIGTYFSMFYFKKMTRNKMSKQT